MRLKNKKNLQTEKDFCSLLRISKTPVFSKLVYTGRGRIVMFTHHLINIDENEFLHIKVT